MRYFKPANWNSLSWFLQLAFKYEERKSPLSRLSRQAQIQMSRPTQVSQEDAVGLVDDLLRYVPQALSTALNTLVRKSGLMFVIRLKNPDAMMEEEVWPAVELALEKKADELLYRKFPDADPEIHATLKEYFVKQVW